MLKRSIKALPDLPQNVRLSDPAKLRMFEADRDLIGELSNLTGHEETAVKRMGLHYGLVMWRESLAKTAA